MSNDAQNAGAEIDHDEDGNERTLNILWLSDPTLNIYLIQENAETICRLIPHTLEA